MRACLTAVAWCLFSGWSVSAYAHHSYTAYAVDQPIEISGIVSRVGFVNPHAYFMVDVTDDTGAVTSWRVETTAPAVLRRRGWDSSTIQVGDRLAATGAPLTSGDPEMNLEYFDLPDGTRLLRTGNIVAGAGLGSVPPGPAGGAAGMGMGMGPGSRPIPAEPEPSDAPRELLTGVWATNLAYPDLHPRDPRGQEIMTEAGRARFDTFDVDRDNMGNCRLVGAPRMARGTIYTLEIVDNGDIIYMISEYNAQTRRIYMDGRAPHKYFAPNRLGWSNGEFADGVLTITTRHMTEERIDGAYIFGGGEDAYVVERIYMGEDGNELHYFAWFHDPVHYTEPFRTLQGWERVDIDQGFVLDCEPVDYSAEQ